MLQEHACGAVASVASAPGAYFLAKISQKPSASSPAGSVWQSVAVPVYDGHIAIKAFGHVTMISGDRCHFIPSWVSVAAPVHDVIK